MRASIRVLGTLDVQVGDAPVDIGGPAQRVLTALLAATPGPLTADAIARALWGEQLPARHRQQVQKRVHMVRAKLGAEAVTTHEDGYALACHTDLCEFTERLGRARALRESDPAAALTAYRAALALWRGPAFDGLPGFVDIAAKLTDLRAEATAELQALDSAPASLPVTPPGFVGRAEALAELDSAGPLTVITGQPGVGKTALAIRWAHDQPHAHRFYLNLHGFDAEAPMTPGDALRHLLRALNVDHQRIPPELDDQVALYRSLLAGRKVLVVLDNALDEAQVRPLLPPDATSTTVITSRHDLRGLVALDDAHRIALDVLPEPEACRLLGTADTALAKACGYLPLALRLAAASGGSAASFTGDAPLRAAFDLSYRALPAAAARLFRLLGLLPRPEFTPAAAQALLDAHPGVELDVLEHANLVERHRHDRYRIHDLLHAYARELPHEPEAFGRLVDHYVRTTDAALDLLAPDMTRLSREAPQVFTDPASALRWLDDQHQCLVDIARHGHEWLMADALRRYWWQTGRADKGLEMAEAGLAAAIAEGNELAQASMHHAIGTTHMASTVETGLHHFTLAEKLFGAVGATDNQVSALYNIAGCQTLLTGHPEAIVTLRRALELAAPGDRRATGHMLLAVAFSQGGRLPEALAHHEEELRERGETETTTRAVASMSSLGWVTRHLGQLDRTAAIADHMRDMAARTGLHVWRLHTLHVTADLALDTGHTATALKDAAELLALAEGNAMHFIAYAGLIAGTALQHVGRAAEGVDALEHGLRAATGSGAANLAALVTVQLARACLVTGDRDRATELAMQTLPHNNYLIAHGLTLATLAHLHEGAERRRFAEQALATHRKSGLQLGQAEAYLLLGEDERAEEIFAHYTGRPDHAPAGVLVGRPCAYCG